MSDSTGMIISSNSIQNSERKSSFFHCSPDHCSVSLAAINRMRKNNQLCDVVLRTGENLLPAHKVVLSSASPYFHAMFNDDLAEKLKTEITIQDIDASALKILVDFSYTGQVTITEENVQVLLPASSILQMLSVREACCKFLMRQLHPTNCLGIKSFADAHSCKELLKQSQRFALHHFQDVVSTEEFMLLPFNEIKDLISNTQLNITSEEKVFLAVLSWVRHDLSSREKYISELMKHVRLPLMSRNFLLSHVDSEILIRENSECKELLLEAMRYHLSPEQRSAFASERTILRKPEGLKPYLFAVGGGSLFAIHSECEVFNPRTESWNPIAPMLYRRSRSGVTGLGNLLYVVGGYDGASDLATAEIYEYQINKWTAITPMGTKRSCLGICSHDGLIYVCGGYDGASCLSSMERYDPLTGIWSSCPAMNTKRRYCRIAVVENCIYAVGGFDSSNYQATVERWDPRTSSWSSVPSMSSRRSSCGVTAMDGMLYCIGGNDGTMCMASGERLNLRRNIWEPISPMQNRRSTHEVVHINGCLYALGGNDGSSSLNSVETYYSKSNKWTLSTSMLTRRSSVGAAVLECLNIEKALLSCKS
ncbi:conserved hypothetical protein [Pediculus humanus corporis]|uniref:Kelch-like protein diablo n=1 Tax=Pediculus humanus subsp. corporis TaxID=121224 RepID=E0VR25_PEDHC|nr:uncharacterized protein Phum_PHUM390860 [Pediculus humanus corporis]EEB15831.1 conserved hypothetical protein [Pediculus humanus corporis]